MKRITFRPNPVDPISHEHLQAWAIGDPSESSAKKAIKLFWRLLLDRQQALKEVGIAPGVCHRIFQPDNPREFMKNVDAMLTGMSFLVSIIYMYIY